MANDNGSRPVLATSEASRSAAALASVRAWLIPWTTDLCAISHLGRLERYVGLL